MEVEWVKNDFSTDLSLRIDVFLVNRDGLQNENCQKKVNWIGRHGGRGVNVSPLTIFIFSGMEERNFNGSRKNLFWSCRVFPNWGI